MKFVEDMTPEERARALNEKTGGALPVGLENLGNTCYMNATLQCLKRVDELKNTLKEFQDSTLDMDPSKLLTKAAKKLFTEMDLKGEPFAPSHFVQVMRTVFPQFNETDDHGHHK
jgi:ubiquitin carboxyl-terminal hydrolase 14